MSQSSASGIDSAAQTQLSSKTSTNLLHLPNEVLLQVLQEIVPDPPKGEHSAFASLLRDTNHISLEYLEYMRIAAVSKRFRQLARDAFFNTYMALLRICLYAPLDDDPIRQAVKRDSRVETSLDRYSIFRTRLQRLHLHMEVWWTEYVHEGVELLKYALRKYPSLMEVQLDVTMIELKEDGAEIACKMWEVLCAWRKRRRAKRKVKLGMTVWFDDKRLTYHAYGAVTVKDLRKPRNA
ncbi:hypothetical protein BAUCODRAFT_145833 [Baudoinia panamericana UAMH 10762]|uniref:Uncharacterized protein n=1 Tax=Baudoinia panamericana (strain UAMH 10762) TaxID=717646 RepID=M2LVW4_BAUPA|nr:uncharacterized protein BAUCODRAFT_145833 [Baudoinia panamericana UAMH 10762]EMC98812.1 hypothetical protein BAUCODRAFT_145833 [Baudoinia panamericana UAMH 10762]